MYETQGFKYKELAALVASKVYYHLGEYEEALEFALGAGTLFDTSLKTDYVETIICKNFYKKKLKSSTRSTSLAKCIDKYISLKTQQIEEPKKQIVMDARLEEVVQRMFQRCLKDKEFHQVKKKLVFFTLLACYLQSIIGHWYCFRVF